MEANTNIWTSIPNVHMNKINGRTTLQVTCPRLLLKIIVLLSPEEQYLVVGRYYTVLWYLRFSRGYYKKCSKEKTPK